MDILKYVLGLVLSLILNLPGTADAHTTWTIQECVLASRFVQALGKAKEAGADKAKAQDAALKVLTILKGEKGSWVQDSLDVELGMNLVEQVYALNMPANDMYASSFTACFDHRVPEGQRKHT